MQLLSFVDLLGRGISDPELERGFAALGIDCPISTEVILDTHYVIAKPRGLSFVFEPAKELRSRPHDVGSKVLALANVTAYGENSEGYTPFPEALPGGIQFGDSRDSVHSTLGKPAWNSPIMPIDRWHFDSHRLIADFVPNTSTLKSLALEVP